MKKRQLHFYFFALAALGEGLSGGDRICIQLAKKWSKTEKVDVFVWEEGFRMFTREGLGKEKVAIHNFALKTFKEMGFFALYIARIILGIWIGSTLQIENSATSVVYSASDFWMDSLPGWILKKRFPKITWIGSFYLAAPNPFIGFREKGSGHIPSLKDIIYWTLQKPIYWILTKDADIVFVTSVPDGEKFPLQKKSQGVVIIKGGVDLELVGKWKKKLGKQQKLIDAVFMGRFHPQKGIFEMIEIWKKVVQKKHSATLVMIGDGPLFKSAREKITKEHLKKNILLKGYLFDGEEKYKIFAQSKMVVHPAIYDSGGMAAAEAMAWGLPGISFDLEALKTYYPKGMVKVQIGNNTRFADVVIKLLLQKKFYSTIKNDAQDLVEKQWDWTARAKYILALVQRKVNLHEDKS